MSVLGQYAAHRNPDYNYLGCHGQTYDNGRLRYGPPNPYQTQRHAGSKDTTAYYNLRTHSDIGQQCFDMGARLCSLDELLSGQPHYFDKKKIYKRSCGYGRTFWSSTPCGPGNQGFFYRCNIRERAKSWKAVRAARGITQLGVLLKLEFDFDEFHERS
jgi:hypothetical protein